MDKKCFKCGIEKPIGEFYAHPQMADGHLNKCKECAKIDTKNNYRANPEAHRSYEKGREQAPERKAKKLEYQRRMRERKRLEYMARSMVGNAMREGRLVRGVCADCGTTENIEAHHEDYYKPLNVVWLCFNCHRRRHGQDVLINIPKLDDQLL